jgi:carbon storage regulator
MLVLSRKIGEEVMIGQGITITVLNMERGVVRLGIVAPRDIAVHRKEVYDKIVEANRQAAGATVHALKEMMNSADKANLRTQTPDQSAEEV